MKRFNDRVIPVYDVCMEKHSRVSTGFAQPDVVLMLGIVLVLVGVCVAWWTTDAPVSFPREDVVRSGASTSIMDSQGFKVANPSQGLMVELDGDASLFALIDARGSTTGMRMFDFCSATPPVTAMREEQCIEWGVEKCSDVTEEMVSELCREPYDRREEVSNSGMDSFSGVKKIHVIPDALLSPYRVTFETDALVYQTLTVGSIEGGTRLSQLSFPMGAGSRVTFAIEVVDTHLDVRQVHLDLFGDAERVYTLSHTGIDVDTKCTILHELLLRATMSNDVRASLVREVDALRAYTLHKDTVARVNIETALSTHTDGEAGEYANVIRLLLDEISVVESL